MKNELKNNSLFVTSLEWKRITAFAFVKAETEKGNMLSILGKDYHAWGYDVYIYDAIDLAEKWLPHQITFDRIIHLRNWLRENVQHGHDRCFKHLSSMHSVKLWLVELLEAEYGQDEYWAEQKQFALKENWKLFKKVNDDRNMLAIA